jgi:predicted DNA-binding antitoxin AbrB/MazE fold protein
MIYDVDAIYDHGVFRLFQSLDLPDGVLVRLRIEDVKREGASPQFSAQVHSPRLAHPEQIAEFEMEVREVPDAGI